MLERGGIKIFGKAFVVAARSGSGMSVHWRVASSSRITLIALVFGTVLTHGLGKLFLLLN